MESPKLSWVESATSKINEDEDTVIENSEKAYQNYREKISGMPTVKGFFNYDICSYQGSYYRPKFFKGLMGMQDHFNAHSSDIFLASHPKSGTTWLKALIFSIVNRRSYEGDTHPLLTKNPHELVPFLDMNLYCEGYPSSLLEDMSAPRLFSTHVHYRSLPKSVIDSTCKIIYIWRDPKDVFVSYWHFHLKISQSEDKLYVPTHDQFTNDFDFFCEGLYNHGSFSDRVLSYWKASIKNPQTILFLRYEDMLKDPCLYVEKVAKFIDQPFSPEEEEIGELQHIVDLCSLKSLQSFPVNNVGKTSLVPNSSFYRNGVTGDWKNHLTIEMAARLDKIVKQKFEGYGLKI